MEVTRLFDFLTYQMNHYPQEHCIGTASEGPWQSLSTRKLQETADKLSSGLLKLGVQRGDMVGIVSYVNRPEWIITDIALQQIGAIAVPVYPTISSREYSYIFNEAEVRFCFVGGEDLYDKVNHSKQDVPSLKEIFTYEPEGPGTFWESLLSDVVPELEKAKEGIKGDDLVTIIYTSGTTGNPKGVMLTHDNIVSNIKSVYPLIPIKAGHRTLSFLPLCHVFERVVTYAYFFVGANVYYTGLNNLGGESGDLQKVKPHFFTTVPRLLEKVYEKIYNKGLELTGIKRFLFFWALRQTEDYDYDKEYSGLSGVKQKIADKLIFSKWRQALGGEVLGILTGAAPCPEKMAKIFSAAGIPVREGYGLTEASPGISINRYEPGGAKLGTVGPLIDGIKVRIDNSLNIYREGEGEILMSGPNVMHGYYKKPVETTETIKTIDGERWLCTGDVGKLVTGPKGRMFLKITDRKKELLRTSTGKYVAPAPLENKFKESFLIEQIMVVGENKKFVSALIIPAEDALRDWCDYKEIEWTNPTEMVKHPRVQEKYQRIVDEYNQEFGKVEQIKKFHLMATTWEAIKADGSDSELTPTMKLKRRVISEKHKEEIESLYSD